MKHLFLFLIQPWHLVVLGVVGFVVFGIIGLLPPGPRTGPPWKAS